MDYSYIFRSAVPDYPKFEKFGFEKHGETYICKKPLSETDFYVLLTVHDEKLTAEVYETGADFATQFQGSFCSNLLAIFFRAFPRLCK